MIVVNQKTAFSHTQRLGLLEIVIRSEDKARRASMYSELGKSVYSGARTDNFFLADSLVTNLEEWLSSGQRLAEVNVHFLWESGISSPKVESGVLERVWFDLLTSEHNGRD